MSNENRRNLREHRILAFAAGAGPLVAVTSTLSSAIGYGCLFFVLLILSRLILTVARGLIPPSQRSAYTILVAAFLTSLFQILLQTFQPWLVQQLGLFLPLLAVHAFMIDTHALFAKEATYSELVGKAGKDGGLMFVLLVLVGVVREVLGKGSLTFWQGDSWSFGVTIPGLDSAPLQIFSLIPAGFILFGLLIAFVRPADPGKG